MLLLFLIWIAFFPVELHSLVFLLYFVLFSALCGFQFPVAANIIGEKTSPAAGCLAADLCGASVGTLVTGTLLIPLWGIGVAVIFLILVKVTSGMHDITEGGLTTALEELSMAGGHQIKVNMDTIPVFEQTRKICGLLGIDPLGLIGSGSLLICCRESGCEGLMSAIRTQGIDVTCIGEVLEEGRGIIAEKDGQPAPWPQFETDEITRLF